MSTLSHLLDLQGQICYAQCGYCTTILLVSVPYSSLSATVTVKCGHCTSLFTVNMIMNNSTTSSSAPPSSFLPLHHLFASFRRSDQQATTEVCPGQQEVGHTINADQKCLDDDHVHINNTPISDHQVASSSDIDEEVEETQVINKPPERRQRAPSAYNRFIGEEIQRLKAVNPGMTHKQAFSTAAKSWAHLPLGLHENEGESQAAWKLDDALI